MSDQATTQELVETTVTDEAIDQLWDDVAKERADAPAEEPPRQEPEAAGTPEQEPEPEAAPTPEPPATPAMQARLEALERALQETDRRARTAEGRVSAVQSELDRARAQAQQAAQPQPPSAQDVLAASKNSEKWKALKQDWPEMAESVEAFVEESLRAQRASGSTQPVVDPQAMTAFVQQEVSKVRQEIASELVEDAHNGWQSTVKTPEFYTWFQSQPADVQALAASDKPRDAIRMLDLFSGRTKAGPSNVASQRREVLRAAVGKRPSNQASPTTKSPEDMSEDELWEYEARRRNKQKAQPGF